MRRTLPLAMWVTLVAASPAAQALGLAEPRVESNLNEPLRARIALTDLGGIDPSLLKARLASESAFAQAGLERSVLAEGVRMSLAPRAGGMDLVLTSERAVHEPYLDLLVTLLWPNGEQRRQVTLLFDPSGYASAPALVDGAASVAASPRSAGNVSQPEVAAAPRGTTGPATGGASAPRRVQVQPGDTLWGVAQRVRPDSDVSIDQAMLALQQANPAAFPDGNINGLRAGAVLDVPSRQAMLASTASEAGNRVESQHQAWRDAASDERDIAANDGQADAEPSATASAPASEASPRLTLLSDADLAAEREAQEGESASPADAGAGVANDDAASTGGAPATSPGAERRLAQLEAKWQISRDALDQVRQERDRLEGELAGLRGEVAELREMLMASTAAPASARSSRPESTAEPGTPPPTPATSPVNDTGGSGIWRLVSDNLLAIAGLALAVLLALWLWVRRRNAAAQQAPRPATPVSQASANAQGTGAAVLRSTPPPSPAPQPVAGTALAGAPQPSAPQAEIINEADIFIAYGRYDQARDLLSQSLEQEPQRHDLRLKLLAVLVELGEREAAESEAALLEIVDELEYQHETRRLMQQFAAPGTQDVATDAVDEPAVELTEEQAVDERDHEEPEVDTAGEFASSVAGEAPQPDEWQATGLHSEDPSPEAATPAAASDETAGASDDAFIEYEPPALDPAPVARHEAPQQPSIDFPGRHGVEDEPAEASVEGDDRPRRAADIGPDWEIEEVAFEPLNLDNEQPATGASHTSPEQLLEHARQRLDEGEPGSARELLQRLLEENDDTRVVEEARVLIERHNLY